MIARSSSGVDEYSPVHPNHGSPPLAWRNPHARRVDPTVLRDAPPALTPFVLRAELPFPDIIVVRDPNGPTILIADFRLDDDRVAQALADLPDILEGPAHALSAEVPPRQRSA